MKNSQLFDLVSMMFVGISFVAEGVDRIILMLLAIVLLVGSVISLFRENKLQLSTKERK